MVDIVELDFRSERPAESCDKIAAKSTVPATLPGLLAFLFPIPGTNSAIITFGCGGHSLATGIAIEANGQPFKEFWALADTILFVHGMFQNANSWNGWVTFFYERGYDCVAVSWPLHDGELSALRSHPPEGLRDLRLQTVIDHYVGLIKAKGIRLSPLDIPSVA
ncbi:hypothetical protein [Fimbriiglobus ruber]|uniref:hypothetical protein n=1 Tax=Fimbriiglobus ruber TaxID=1908690 RepID=UPI00117A4E40|nr:hypothetical protein [Fimbriiglobus ruber]